MGAFLSAFKELLRSKVQQRLLMLGLDGAGKTTILYSLKLGEAICTIPTIGFNVEQVEYKNLRFTIWDVGGQDKIRPLWKHYFSGANGLIFVVDSNDKERLADARNELHKLMTSPELANAVILIFANKQDLPLALTPNEIADQLGLKEGIGKGRSWWVQACIATKGDGLQEGLDYLAREINRKRIQSQ